MKKLEGEKRLQWGNAWVGEKIDSIACGTCTFTTVGYKMLRFRNECVGGSSAGHVLHFSLKGINLVIHATNINYKKIVNLYVLHNQAQMTSGEQSFCFCLMFYFWYSLQGSENIKFQWRVSKFASFAGALDRIIQMPAYSLKSFELALPQ